jgi:hypothetical protein
VAARRRSLLPALVVIGGCVGVLPPGAAPVGPSGSGTHDPEPITTVELATESRASLRTVNQFIDDPGTDDWHIEAVTEAIGKQLKTLGKMLGSPDEITPDVLRGLVASDFSATPLRPEPRTEVYRGDTIMISRAALPRDEAARTYTGTDGFREAVRHLAEPFGSTTNLQTEFKAFRIDLGEGGTVETHHHVSLWGHTAEGSLEENATWQCEWILGENRDPILRTIVVLDFEQARVTSPQKTWFADCTEAVLGHNACFQDQLLYGLEHWMQRIERIHFVSHSTIYGIAVGDVNGDGLDDVYVCQTGNLPNRLLIQNADGTATDHSAAAGVDWLTHTSSALLLDLDNDGDQDLCTAMPFLVLVMENDGTGRFTVRAGLPVSDFDVESFTAADYDNDGDLDLYLCVDFATSGARPGERFQTFVYHDSNDGAANVMFRNDIDGDTWAFVNVTKETGLDENNRRHSLAAAWEDYDNDGDQDLYVGNDYGKNCLYRNDGDFFTEVAGKAGVVDQASGMSVSWADSDHDGDMDLYVANMFSYAGSRITRQERFQPTASGATRGVYQRFAKGNSFFENQGGGRFAETGAEAAVEMGRWAWSSLFTDLNNDGWEDLVVANGYFTTEDSGDL